jgi:8-oxo-dGTP pyrophosphatase MutT (NUDIX family)
MSVSDYIRDVRAKIGHDLLMLPSVTAIVFDERDRMLLARHWNGGVWVAPGGAIEPEEIPADAVVRETWEETGLLVKPVGVLGTISGPDTRVRYAHGDVVVYVMSLFHCEIVGGTLQADGTETLQVGFFGREEIERLHLSAWARVVLPHLFRRPLRPYFAPSTWTPPVTP